MSHYTQESRFCQAFFLLFHFIFAQHTIPIYRTVISAATGPMRASAPTKLTDKPEFICRIPWGIMQNFFQFAVKKFLTTCSPHGKIGEPHRMGLSCCA